jgi:hypothetical protein
MFSLGGGTERRYRNPEDRVADNPAEIRIGYVPKLSLQLSREAIAYFRLMVEVDYNICLNMQTLLYQFQIPQLHRHWSVLCADPS